MKYEVIKKKGFMKEWMLSGGKYLIYEILSMFGAFVGYYYVHIGNFKLGIIIFIISFALTMTFFEKVLKNMEKKGYMRGVKK